MTLLRCIDPNISQTHVPQGMHDLWLYGILLCLVFYFFLFLFSLIPIIRYYQEIKLLTGINSAIRYCFTFALFLKILTQTTILLGSRYIESDKILRIVGYISISVPSYFITTCYTLVLISWIIICNQILPFKIVEILQKAKVVLIIYNIVIYILCIAAVGIEFKISDPPNPNDKTLHKVSAYFDISRDLFLFLIFALFIIALELGLGDDSYTEITIEQKKLFWSVIILAILLLTRGVISLIQVFLDQHQECNKWFFALVMFNEIIIEGIPLFVLLKINNGFLGSQRRISFDLGTNSLLSE